MFTRVTWVHKYHKKKSQKEIGRGFPTAKATSFYHTLFVAVVAIVVFILFTVFAGTETAIVPESR